MEALANKETAAKEKEEKQKQAVEDREKRRHQSGTDLWGQETELPCWGQKGPLMYQEKGPQTSPYSVFFEYEQERMN